MGMNFRFAGALWQSWQSWAAECSQRRFGPISEWPMIRLHRFWRPTAKRYRSAFGRLLNISITITSTTVLVDSSFNPSCCVATAFQ